MGNGHISQTSSPVPENAFLQELSGLNFKTDQSFLSLFFKNSLNKDEEDAENENFGGETEMLEDQGSRAGGLGSQQDQRTNMEVQGAWGLTLAEMRKGKHKYFFVSSNL